MSIEYGGIIRWGRGRVNADAADAASAAQAVPSGELLELRASVDCWVAFGDDSVAATADINSHLFLRGTQSFILPVLDAEGTAPTHFSVMKANSTDDDGVVQISQLR